MLASRMAWGQLCWAILASRLPVDLIAASHLAPFCFLPVPPTGVDPTRSVSCSLTRLHLRGCLPVAPSEFRPSCPHPFAETLLPLHAEMQTISSPRNRSWLHVLSCFDQVTFWDFRVQANVDLPIHFFWCLECSCCINKARPSC